MKTLDTDELTAINEEIRIERTLKNITRRASCLFSEEYGYHAKQTLAGTFANCYIVTSPKGDRYTVKTTTTNAAPGSFYGARCSCPCFAELKTCKHYLALCLLEAQEADEAAQIAAGEERERLRDMFELDLYLYDR